MIILFLWESRAAGRRLLRGQAWPDSEAMASTGISLPQRQSIGSVEGPAHRPAGFGHGLARVVSSPASAYPKARWCDLIKLKGAPGFEGDEAAGWQARPGGWPAEALMGGLNPAGAKAAQRPAPLPGSARTMWPFRSRRAAAGELL